MSDTLETTLVITNPTGLHLRPAALFVKTAARFQSQVHITNLDRDASKEINAKSMFSVMQLGVAQNHKVRVRATGVDAADAIAALEHLVATDFAEPA